MTNLEKSDLQSMLRSMRPDSVRELHWRNLSEAAIDVVSYENDPAFVKFVELCKETLQNDPEWGDVILGVVRKYVHQLRETEPDLATADRQAVSFSTWRDNDGYIDEDIHFRTVYVLKRPWRNFLPGQSIYLRPAQQCIGGSVPAMWCLHLQ